MLEYRRLPKGARHHLWHLLHNRHLGRFFTGCALIYQDESVSGVSNPYFKAASSRKVPVHPRRQIAS